MGHHCCIFIKGIKEHLGTFTWYVYWRHILNLDSILINREVCLLPKPTAWSLRSTNWSFTKKWASSSMLQYYKRKRNLPLCHPAALPSGLLALMMPSDVWHMGHRVRSAPCCPRKAPPVREPGEDHLHFWTDSWAQLVFFFFFYLHFQSLREEDWLYSDGDWYTFDHLHDKWGVLHAVLVFLESCIETCRYIKKPPQQAACGFVFSAYTKCEYTYWYWRTQMLCAFAFEYNSMYFAYSWSVKYQACE